jgi:hypothetical protein
MTECCENCRFSKVDKENYGKTVLICRRMPPQNSYAFCKTYSYEWCGEYQANGDENGN